MTDVQTPSDVPPAVPPQSRMVRWLAPLFLIAGVGLVPWTVYLSLTLPSRHVQTGYYDVAWGGFDLALAAALFATGVGLQALAGKVADPVLAARLEEHIADLGETLDEIRATVYDLRTGLAHFG